MPDCQSCRPVTQIMLPDAAPVRRRLPRASFALAPTWCWCWCWCRERWKSMARSSRSSTRRFTFQRKNSPKISIPDGCSATAHSQQGQNRSRLGALLHPRLGRPGRLRQVRRPALNGKASWCYRGQRSRIRTGKHVLIPSTVQRCRTRTTRTVSSIRGGILTGCRWAEADGWRVNESQGVGIKLGSRGAMHAENRV